MLDSLGFDLRYSARPVEFSPTGTAPEFEFKPRWSRGLGPWLHVRVEPFGGAAWTGAFEFDQLRGESSLSGLYGMPASDHLLVVAAGQGYVVPVQRPSGWHRPPVAPVRGVRRAEDSDLLVMWDWQDLVVYGPEGPLWRLDHLATDDLEVTSADQHSIKGLLWHGWEPSGSRQAFEVNSRTGEILQGYSGGGPAQPCTGDRFWQR